MDSNSVRSALVLFCIHVVMSGGVCTVCQCVDALFTSSGRVTGGLAGGVVVVVDADMATGCAHRSRRTQRNVTGRVQRLW